MSAYKTVCVVGGGPAGMFLALLLARQGISVTLLLAHEDFDRAFRGDTLHSTTMELLDDLGLVDRIEPLLQSKIQKLQLITDSGALDFVDLGLLRTRYPYVGLLPQVQLLDILAEEAKRYDGFELKMGCQVRELIEEDGRVVGVRYKSADQLHDLRAALIVGADGRGSRVRKEAGFELKKMSPPMDVLWFDLPLGEGDGSLHPLSLRVGDGTMLVHVHRGDHWQLGCVIAKGSYRELKAAGLDALRADIVRLVPPFGTRIDLIDDWKQMAVLSVSVGRIERWHKPGLLCIGDAAHVMSPVGGVGINYAVKDAVAAANLLTDPLKAGTLGDSDLARVQARREFPTKLIQGVQTLIQKRVIKAALKGGSFRIPLLMRILGRTPLLRRLPARLIGR